MDQITIIKPDDWHLHVRDGETLKDVVPATAKQFARAIIMPNLKPPVTTVDKAIAYRQRILDVIPSGIEFNPLMTLYLTDNISAEDIHAAVANPHMYAVKYYPAGATTNSDSGVSDLTNTYHAIEVMEETGLPLLIHGEVTDPTVDIFDREAVFIETVLIPLLQRFPKLRVVLEHITTQQAAEFIQATADNIAATVTPQHLLMNRNAIFKGGINPHNYCLPVLKREKHRIALLESVMAGSHKFFLGTDSAPHARTAKESSCGCAGIYSAPCALELYAEIFDEANALDKLEGFASINGPRFYQLPQNTQTITLVRKPWTLADHFPFGDETIIPVRAGETINWSIIESS